MRTYKFYYKNTDDPDFPINVKFKDKFKSYLEDNETDLNELAREVRYFIKAQGYDEGRASGMVFINWHLMKYKDPEYDDIYLISLKDHEYAEVDNWINDHWEHHNKEDVEAWADMPPRRGSWV